MKKTSVAIIVLFAIAAGYGIGYTKAEKKAALFLAEQYVKSQLIECTFDRKGISQIKEGTEGGISFLESRIQFRLNDLNHKLEENTFWEVFVPSCLESASHDLNPDEIYHYLSDWNKSYQSDMPEDER